MADLFALGWDALKFFLPMILAGVLFIWRLSAQIDKQRVKTDADLEMIRASIKTLDERIRENETALSIIGAQLQTLTVMTARIEERLGIFLNGKRQENS